MATIRAADGGYLLNSDQFNYTKDAQGRPVLNVKDGVGGAGGASGDFKSDGTVPMSGNLYMNGNNIMGVKSISNTDSGMAGWSVPKGAVANSIKIDNKSDAQPLDVYIIALGAGSAIG